MDPCKVFLSSKSEVERKQKFSEWQNEFGVELDFLNFITSESKQLEYANSGMPNDSLSLENASAVLGFIRPTFILDQSGRSQAFIKPGFLRFCFFIGCIFSDRLATDSAVLSYFKAF